MYICLDCKVDTHLINEYYILKDNIWLETGVGKHDGKLCIGCVENRIGRKLNKNDFLDIQLNFTNDVCPRSERLINRTS